MQHDYMVLPRTGEFMVMMHLTLPICAAQEEQEFRWFSNPQKTIRHALRDVDRRCRNSSPEIKTNSTCFINVEGRTLSMGLKVRKDYAKRQYVVHGYAEYLPLHDLFYIPCENYNIPHAMEHAARRAEWYMNRKREIEATGDHTKRDAVYAQCQYLAKVIADAQG
jgi:hypothetical protein